MKYIKHGRVKDVQGRVFTIVNFYHSDIIPIAIGRSNTFVKEFVQNFITLECAYMTKKQISENESIYHVETVEIPCKQVLYKFINGKREVRDVIF